MTAKKIGCRIKNRCGSGRGQRVVKSMVMFLGYYMLSLSQTIKEEFFSTHLVIPTEILKAQQTSLLPNSRILGNSDKETQPHSLNVNS